MAHPITRNCFLSTNKSNFLKIQCKKDSIKTQLKKQCAKQLSDRIKKSEFVPRYWQHKSETHHQPVSEALLRNARSAWVWIDWMPARLTAVGFAVVGNFEEAIDSWHRYTGESVTSNDGLVLAATAGAVNVHLAGAGWSATLGANGQDVSEDAKRAPPPELAHLAVVVGLVWRTVVMWMVLLSLLTLG